MSWQNKPGVQWDRVREEFENRAVTGDSMRGIAARHGISHKSIEKRRDKEGWVVYPEGRPKDDFSKAVESLPSVIAQASGEVNTRVRTAERAKIILDNLLDGRPPKTAAAIAEISKESLEKWRQDDPQFNTMCEKAVELYRGRHIDNINGAADRGDHRAALVALSIHPELKRDYEQKGNGGPNIQVVINVERAAPETANIEGGMVGEIIDLRPERTHASHE